MTTTPTPPTFRDGIEAAAKVVENLPTGRGDIWLQNAFMNAARRIRAIPTPDTLPTGWNSDTTSPSSTPGTS